MTAPTLSKQKMIDALRAANRPLDGNEDERMFIYSISRNIMADVLLVEIMMGNLDSD
jgi:hypothetical protein